MGVITDPASSANTTTVKRRFRQPLFIVSALSGLLLAVVIIFVQHHLADAGPVPADVRKQVNFAVYYPIQSKLPNGYILDTTSFRLAQPGVVVYAVRNGSAQLVFSEEATPDGNIVDKFTSSYIPLHNTITTAFGKAQFGSAGQGPNLQTVVSLPITNGPWLIITAPAGTKQSDMQHVLQSLSK